MIVPSIPLEEVERLNDLIEAKILDTPIQEGFERITRLAKQVFNVPVVAISLIDARRQWLKSAQGFDACETSREVAFCAHTILQEDIMVVPDALLDPRFIDHPSVIGEPYIRFYAGCPIKSPRGYNYGAICLVDFKPRDLSTEELALFQDIGGLVETEIHRHNSCVAQEKLIQRLDHAKLALMVDPLTRLWNRVGMLNILNNHLEEAALTGNSFGLALLGIDHFKEINDTFGHEAGDNVLRTFAKTLISLMRDRDACSRWGGEEFLIMINDPSKQNVMRIADRIRRKIAETSLRINDYQTAKTTVTIGITMYSPANPLSLDALINQADQALYKGKAQGRNKAIG